MQFLQAEDIWYEFFNTCLEKAASNFDYIAKTQERAVLQLPDSVVEEIIERALKMRGRTEDTDLVRLMMRMKKVTSPFELLTLEKQRVTQTYEKLVHTKSSIKDPLLSATVNSN